jgi:hypothetical protein
VVAVVGSACGNCNRAEAVRATPLVNGSDSWLAEVRAEARDAALEEAADCFGMSADQERIRALKRGGK